MAKRGRPPKQSVTDISTPEVKAAPTSGVNNSPKRRGRPRKQIPTDVGAQHAAPLPHTKLPHLPHRQPDTFDRIWANAQVLSATITDHYAMTLSEQAEALRYALLLEPKANLVELGITHGRTAAVLAYAAQLLGFNYYGVDNFTLEGSESETRANLDRLHLPYTLLVGNTQDVPWHKPIDYLLIDAGHDVRNVTQDTLRWLPLVQPGGLVLYHAYNRTIDQTDPHWGIKNCVDTYCGLWETLSVIPWLIIKRKPLQM